MRIITGSFETASSGKSSRRPRISYFSRPELQRILNVYARCVSDGEWRDYSIDHLEDGAVFSIYRSSHETPIYTIEKKRLKGNDRWIYTLSDRRKKIKSGTRLQDILDKLNALPKLVNN
jgi:hypothetical protein